ncbi:T9SS type A sorting domain-containing protein [Bacteroidota bacterium]
MKRFLLLIVLGIFIQISAFAQSLELIKKDGSAIVNDSINIATSNDSSVIEVPVYVKNISTKTLDVFVKVYIKNLVSGSTASYCWGSSCFDISTSPSTTSTSILATDTAKEFHSDYNPQKNLGITEIMYTFYVDKEEEDSVSVSVFYEIMATGINSLSEITESISSYPNPVESTLYFGYDLKNAGNSFIKIYDIVGKQIKSQKINRMDKTAEISVAELNTGLYIWTFELDGNPIKSNKFIKK